MSHVDRKYVLLFPVLMFSAFIALPACYAQAIAVAEVQGQVLDASGAAVSGAQIKMTQTETDYSRTIAAGADGSYSVPNLPVGP